MFTKNRMRPFPVSVKRNLQFFYNATERPRTTAPELTAKAPPGYGYGGTPSGRDRLRGRSGRWQEA